MHLSFLIHSSADGHLGCFHVLAVINCCDEHWGTRVSFNSDFLSVYAQQWDCWVMLLLLLLSRFSRVRLWDPIDGSPPGSPIPGFLQARTVEWVAISFSNAWKWKVKVMLLSRVRLLVTPRTAAYQAPPSMGFSRQEYWSGMPLPSPCLVIRQFSLQFSKESPHCSP